MWRGKKTYGEGDKKIKEKVQQQWYRKNLKELEGEHQQEEKRD